MIYYPNAKINIGLRVVEKRSDGFHNIESVFYPIHLSDILEIATDNEAENPTVKLSTSGIEIEGDASNNLCVKAFQLLKNDFPHLPKIKIHLHKIIPIGAGLGGGSADAAFMLKALNSTFHLSLSENKLAEYAAKLGSDCTFFVYNKPALATGRGEILNEIELNMNNLQIILIYPNIHISTPLAYSLIKPKKPESSLNEWITTPIENWKNAIVNDFEAGIFPKYPILSQIKENLYQNGAIYASMSGSGSTLYGIFPSNFDTQHLKFDASYFVWHGTL